VSTTKADSSRIHVKPDHTHGVRIKRIYDTPAKTDGFRVLVDRLWPRGLSKQAAAIDLWLKDIAPTDELRHWYGHVPEKWTDFKKQYYKELKARPDLTGLLREKAAAEPVTLLFSSKETRLNNAVALAEFLKDASI